MSRYAGKKTGKKIADEETAQKIIAALENESIKYETYFKLIIATGMRRGECCALQWRDIDREQLNIHSLRHTAASLMIAGGADMATVAGILGHSQLSATLDIYTHARTKSRQRRIARDAGDMAQDSSVLSILCLPCGRSDGSYGKTARSPAHGVCQESDLALNKPPRCKARQSMLQ